MSPTNPQPADRGNSEGCRDVPQVAGSPRPWRLSECNYGQLKGRSWDVAVLPLGATEPHNLHLPYGTDQYEAEIIGDRSCELALQAGARVMLLPSIPFGTETNLRQFPLAINLNPSTLHRVITDVVTSLVNSGIQKIVLLNSHGGNDFKPLLRELYGTTSAQLFLYNWYQAIGDVAATVLEHPDDHAGEMETSVGLAYFADLVARDDNGQLLADDGIKRPSRFEAINRGWVSISRPWHLLTTNSGAGNPHRATADKGRRIVEAASERLAAFLIELAASPLDESFPF